MVFFRMRRRDDNGLAWSGRPKEERAGGLVDGVAMNVRPPALAVDPEGVVDADRPVDRGPAGPKLAVERLGTADDPPVQRNGRVRMLPT
jgi:hypothetical protein